MESIAADLAKCFSDLPASPPVSLLGGNALDGYEAAPAYDSVIDRVTPAYLEAHFWGIAHLDSQSWRFYLPHLLGHALQNISNPTSNATDALLFSLRPPDRDPPRFGSLSGCRRSARQARLLGGIRMARAGYDRARGVLGAWGQLPVSWLAPNNSFKPKPLRGPA